MVLGQGITPTFVKCTIDIPTMNIVWFLTVILFTEQFYAKENQKNPIEAALNTLEYLRLNKDPPKGVPFPKVQGPRQDDKVLNVQEIIFLFLK